MYSREAVSDGSIDHANDRGVVHIQATRTFYPPTFLESTPTYEEMSPGTLHRFDIQNLTQPNYGAFSYPGSEDLTEDMQGTR